MRSAAKLPKDLAGDAPFLHSWRTGTCVTAAEWIWLSPSLGLVFFHSDPSPPLPLKTLSLQSPDILLSTIVL